MFCALYTDATTMRFIEPVYSQEKTLKAFNVLVKRSSDPAFNTWVIVNNVNIAKHEQMTAPSIGMVMLYNKAGKHLLNVMEIGIMLLQQARGKQLAEEAFGATLNYGFSQLKLPYINVRFDKRNLAIQRIARKVGFHFNGLPSDKVLTTKNISNEVEKAKNDNGNTDPKNMTIIETVSFKQWQQHKQQYPIQIE